MKTNSRMVTFVFFAIILITFYIAVSIFLGNITSKARAILTWAELKTLDKNVQEAYKLAISKPTIFSHVTCYCGCDATHGSLKKCFIRTEDSRGKITLEQHGSECSTCVKEALAVKHLYSKGFSVKTISDKINREFGNK